MSLVGRAFRQVSRFIPQAAVVPFSRPAAVYFHGVEKKLEDAELQQNHHERENFIAIMRALAERFDVLPLSALDDVLKDPHKHSRALFLMADDGYANLLDAADILEELHLPWTVFVSTAHIGSAERNPMFRARAFLRYAPPGSYTLPHIGSVDFIEHARDEEEVRVMAAFRTLSADEARETLATINAVLTDAGLEDLGALFPSDAFLSWEELKSLAARGTGIGAHGHWHWPMNGRQPQDFLIEQAMLPKRLIEEHTSLPCTAFAYPFGNVDDITRLAWHAVRDAGYSCAFTTLSGTLDASTNRFLLPRYGLSTRETNIASTIAMLRAANARLQSWQDTLR